MIAKQNGLLGSVQLSGTTEDYVLAGTVSGND